MNLGMRAHDLQAETIEQLSRKCQLNDIHSIQLALAMTANGAKWDTKTQMEEVLSGGMTIEN